MLLKKELKCVITQKDEITNKWNNTCQQREIEGERENRKTGGSITD